ncbi:uncharacterized protein AC631_01774 [Debaryomyces fabryi]|uniref:Zinc/iron permease n=1 Tax=Debaryomyces fabryi TaxID=58627 RepID=A0A0V1Q2M2_9ASCO|nr:uncharacterized protein AC631_01774 [Debaryomyces fabryi]KSA02501.1 hypothetical protein AC631_01774 [Debaryomyces fabryi]CUM50409.1 unnamed protein product [Debaryomyces fabryi]
MVDLSFTSNQGWYLTLLSSSLCVLGCFVIYFDDVYTLLFPRSITKKYNFQLKENYLFLNTALAFSSGCLLFTALFRLLPEALEFFNDFNEHDRAKTDKMQKKELNFYLVISFISGILLCFLFNAVLHLVTSQSVVHCNHGSEQHPHSHSHNNEIELVHREGRYNESLNHHEEEHTNSHTHANTGNDIEANIETTPLLDERKPLMRKRSSLIQYFMSHNGDENTLGECKGYTSAELCLFNKNHSSELHFCEIPTLAKSIDLNDDELHAVHSPPSHCAAASTHSHKNNSEYAHPYEDHAYLQGEDHSTHKPDHHHHINTPLSRLLLIGIQTTLAISLHKLPEGFITFITSEANPELGFLIFLSLAAHNFTEGFLMCLPLYFLFSSSSGGFAKLKAVAISSILGGLSQPAGAILGYFFLKYNDKGDSFDIHSLSFVLGISLAVTSGFLTVIGLSMYGSAISFHGGMLNLLLFWCILGMCIIGLSSIVNS